MHGTWFFIAGNLEETHISKKSGIYYGYHVMAAIFFSLFISSGTGWFAFSLFIPSLQKELGWSRGEIMIAFTVYILTGVISPFVGRITERYGASKIFISGALLTALGFVLLSQAHSLSVFILGWGITGAGMSGTGSVPAVVVISNWFTRRRGAAIGIMSAGMGAGGIVLAPIIGAYLIPSFGWRTALLVMAVLNCLIIPVALRIKTRPADRGLSPDGISSETATIVEKMVPVPQEGLTFREALSTSTFWLIGAVVIFSNFSNAGVFQNQFPHLQDIGFPLPVAVTALGSLSFASLIGRFGFGFLSDKITARYASLIGQLLQLSAILILLQVKPSSPAFLIWLYAIVMGLGMASWLPTMTLLVSSNFGLLSYGSIFGTVSMMMSIGVAAGPLIAGHMFDVTRSYSHIFLIYAFLYAISIPAVLAIRRPKQKLPARDSKM